MKEFSYCFQVNRMVIFTVQYYTLGNNNHPYFSTSAGEFIRSKRDFGICGQCQNRILTGKAKRFWEKWDHLHLSDLTKEQYDEIVSDLEELKRVYNYLEKHEDCFANKNAGFPFWQEVELSKMPDKKPLPKEEAKAEEEIEVIDNTDLELAEDTVEQSEEDEIER